MATWTMIKRLVANEEGATAVEYGLIISMIVLAMAAALQGVADVTIDMWSDVKTKVVAANGD